MWASRRLASGLWRAGGRQWAVTGVGGLRSLATAKQVGQGEGEAGWRASWKDDVEEKEEFDDSDLEDEVDGEEEEALEAALERERSIQRTARSQEMLRGLLQQDAWITDAHASFSRASKGSAHHIAFHAAESRCEAKADAVREAVREKARQYTDEEKEITTVSEEVVSLLFDLPDSLPIRLLSNFISDAEHEELLKVFTDALGNKEYEAAHWDHVIANYREIEYRTKGPLVVEQVKDRVQRKVFSDSRKVAVQVPHVLELSAEGYMRPHVDHVSYGGGVICGINLASPVVLTLQPDLSRFLPGGSPAGGRKRTVGGKEGGKEEEAKSLAAPMTGKGGRKLSWREQQLLQLVLEEQQGGSGEAGTGAGEAEADGSLFDPALPKVEILLEPKSLYVLTGAARYLWAHGIERPALHSFEGFPVERTRRLAMLFRDEPTLAS